MNRREILAVVEEERVRQRAKWNREHEWGYGDRSGMLGPSAADIREHNLIKASVLAEQAGKVVNAAIDVDPEQFKTEVIQTLTVAWAILEGIPE